MNYFRTIRVSSFLVILLILAGASDVRSQQREAVDIERLHQEAKSILLRAFDDPQSKAQLAVIESMGNIRLPEAVPQLLNLIKKSEKRVVDSIIIALGNEQPDPAIVAALIERLQKDLSASTRRLAALSLARLGEHAAVPALIDRLRNDREETVRAAAAKALGILQDPRALPVLREELDRLRALLDRPAEAEEMAPVFAGVVGALVAFKEKAVIPVFKAILEAQHPIISTTLFYGSTIIDMVIAVRDTADSAFISEVSEAIRPLLKHPGSLIRMRAALVQRVLGDTSVISVIIDSLEFAKKVGSFDRAFHILEITFFGIFDLVYDDALVPILSELIDIVGQPALGLELFELPLYRGFLTIVLGSVGNERAVLKIIAFLNELPRSEAPIPDSDVTAKSFALVGLGKASKPTSGIIPQTGLILPVLISFTEHRDRLLRETAVQMLGFVGNPLAVPALIRLLEDRELSGGREIREYAIGAFAQIGDVAVLPILSSLFADSNKIIRVKAAAAVLQIVEGRKPVSLANELQSPVGISLTDFSLMSRMMLSMRRALPK